MKKLTKNLLSIVLILSLLTVNFVSLTQVYADELITITIDVNGGNELTTDTVTGPEGKTLSEIAGMQEESWILSFMRSRKQRTYLEGIVNSDSGEPIDPENDPLYEDTNIILYWGDSELYSGEIELEANPPVIGDAYENHPEIGEFGVGIEVQEPTPTINAYVMLLGSGDPEEFAQFYQAQQDEFFEKFDIPFNSRRFLTRSCDDPINENTCFVPVEGEIVAGQKYYLSFYISINDNYYMTNDVRDHLTVNGEAPLLFEEVKTYENGDFEGAWVVVEMDPVEGQQGGQPGQEQFTVQFDTDGGTEINSIQVNDGDVFGRPSPDPVKDNYIFDGWYRDPQRTEEYDFGDPVHEPRTVYAKWVEKNISISTNPVAVNFGEVQISPQENIQRPVSITNNGNVPVTIYPYAPEDDGPFGIEAPDHFVLDVGATEYVTVIINKNDAKASVAGEYTGNYVFTAEELEDVGTINVQLSATVVIVENAPETHTVTFDTDGGTQIDPFIVNHGASVIRPGEEPQKENYIFDTWCADETKNVEYDFTNSVTSDITIYARYRDVEPGETVPVHIVFSGNGGSYVATFQALEPEDQAKNNQEFTNSQFFISVQAASIMRLEAIPVQGYYFEGWHRTHEENGNSWVVDELLTDNTVYEFIPSGYPYITPVFNEGEPPVPEKVTVTFDTDGGQPVPTPVEINKGSTVSQPAQHPQKENYEFAMWCADETKNIPYNFNDPVNSDITIYAKYNPAQGNQSMISVSPDPVEFGTVSANFDTDVEKTITITNTSNTELQVFIGLPENLPLTIKDFTNGMMLAAGNSTTATLVLDHTSQYISSGAYNAVVNVDYYDHGAGSTYELHANFTINEVQQGPTISIVPNAVDFGTIYTNATDDLTQDVIVTNNSNAPVNITITIPTSNGPFNLHAENNTLTVPANGQSTVTLSVDHGADKAKQVGDYDGTYLFSYEGEEPVTVGVQVKVAAPPVEKVIVTFETDGGVPVPDAQEIDKGTTATKPATDPQKDNYTFAVWCADETKNVPYDFSQAVNANMTLYAKYFADLDVTVTPANVSFGTIYTNATEDLTQDVTITNNSVVAVEVMIDIPTDDGPFNIHAENNTLTIPAGEERTVTLSVDHGAQQIGTTGTYNGNYVFNYNEVGEQLGDSTEVTASVTVAEPPVEKVTVTFNTDGGTPVPEAQEIDKGTTATKPATDPQKDNYSFITWCSDANKTQPYDFTQAVNGNITLYAKYTPILNVTVTPSSVDFGTFNIGSTEDIQKTVTVTNNSAVAIALTINTPTSSGPFGTLNTSSATIAAGEQETFTLIVNHNSGDAAVVGTYNGEYLFNYSPVGENLGDATPVSATVVVQNPPVEKVTVTFNTDGGTPVPEAQEINKGTTATKPATDPQKENYTFDTWCSDETKNVPYDFSEEVNANMTLYARYTEVSQGSGSGEQELEILDNTDNQSYNPNSEDAEEGLTIKVSGALADLIKIEVDGVVVESGDVDLKSGSTIATFTPDFLSSLGTGSHTATFYFTSGSISSTFTVAAANNPTTNATQTSNNPSTFDNITSWFELLGVSVLLAASGTYILKKKHN